MLSTLNSVCRGKMTYLRTAVSYQETSTTNWFKRCILSLKSQAKVFRVSVSPSLGSLTACRSHLRYLRLQAVSQHSNCLSSPPTHTQNRLTPFQIANFLIYLFIFSSLSLSLPSFPLSFSLLPSLSSFLCMCGVYMLVGVHLEARV